MKKPYIPARKMRKLFYEIRREAGDPPIPFVSWEVATRYEEKWMEKGIVGYCLYNTAVASSPHQTMRGVRNTIWHEIAHVLFPNKPHWWIYTYAAVMSRFDCFDDYVSSKNKFLSAPRIGFPTRHFPHYFPLAHGFPTRKELLKITRAAAERLRRKRGK